LAKNNQQNLRILADTRTSLETQKRQERIHELGRWDRFRQNRLVVIDNYIAQRKIQTIAEFFYKQWLIK